MQLRLSTLLAWLGAVGSAASANAQGTGDVKNVAIVGAGAAGASAAYHLQQYAENEGLAINITIFERTDRVGGRTLTVNAFDDPGLPVELGASIFVSVNHIMYNAVDRYSLPIRDPEGPGADDITAIWDGESIVYQSVRGTSWWWDATKLWWKYGTSPYTTMKLVKSVVDKFLALYEPPHFPFRSLTQRAFELGLERITGLTGEQFLAENKINANFSHDLIQAATRVNYASNLAYIHGLETMVSLATEGAVAVVGGNWQIFDRMVQDSGGALYRNTTVADISLDQKQGKSAAQSPKYIISTKATGADLSTSEAFPITFDNVIVANPWQFSDITAGEGVLRHRIDKIPYMKLHVTLFTSPFKLRPGYFKLEPGTKAPSNVYTTLNPRDEAHPGPEGVGSAGFYSISTLQAVINPETEKQEFLYKIFSPEVVTAEFLSDILGASVPATFTTSKDAKVSPEMVNPISWYYPHWFYSYPVELPRVTFQDPVVGNGLYYTGGMESFISCMETSALMGMNVARLIANDVAGATSEADESWEEFLEDVKADEGMKVQGMGEL